MHGSTTTTDSYKILYQKKERYKIYKKCFRDTLVLQILIKIAIDFGVEDLISH